MSGTHDAGTSVDATAPHVFEEVDLMPGSLPLGNRGTMGMYSPPPTPPGKSVVCGICRQPRSARIHIQAEAEADAESPRWGM